MATELAQDETLVRAVFDAVAALENAGVDYIVIGGLASSLLGRPRTTRDVDLLVHQDDALRALDALALVGFATEETNPSWIYKAMRGDVMIDRDLLVEGRRLSRRRDARPRTRPCDRLTHGQSHAARGSDRRQGGSARRADAAHWHDALSVLADQELDWDYLIRRARHGARRVLALLLYAQSNDLIVPEDAIKRLYATIYE